MWKREVWEYIYIVYINGRQNWNVVGNAAIYAFEACIKRDDINRKKSVSIINLAWIYETDIGYYCIIKEHFLVVTLFLNFFFVLCFFSQRSHTMNFSQHQVKKLDRLLLIYMTLDAVCDVYSAFLGRGIHLHTMFQQR